MFEMIRLRLKSIAEICEDMYSAPSFTFSGDELAIAHAIHAKALSSLGMIDAAYEKANEEPEDLPAP